jgi:F0F1-type ATP synthase assembly protein I
MANILKLLFKGWLLKKFGAKAGVGCLFFLIVLILLGMFIGFLIVR